MGKYKIINYIEINGEDVRMDSLPEQELKRIAQILQDNVMIPLGYRRKKEEAG